MKFSTNLTNNNKNNQDESVFSQKASTKIDLAQKFRNKNKKLETSLVNSTHISKINKNNSLRASISSSQTSRQKFSRLGRFKRRDLSRNLVKDEKRSFSITHDLKKSKILSSRETSAKKIELNFSNMRNSRNLSVFKNESLSQKSSSRKNLSFGNTFPGNNPINSLSKFNTDEYGFNEEKKQTDINLDELEDYNSSSDLRNFNSFPSVQDSIKLNSQSKNNLSQLKIMDEKSSSNQNNIKKQNTIDNIDAFKSISQSQSRENQDFQNALVKKKHSRTNSLSNNKKVISKSSKVNFNDFQDFGFSSKNNSSPMKLQISSKNSSQINFNKTNTHEIQQIQIDEIKKNISMHSIGIQGSETSFDKKFSKNTILEIIYENEKLKSELSEKNEIISKLEIENKELLKNKKENQILIKNYEFEKTKLENDFENERKTFKTRNSDFSFHRKSSKQKVEELSVLAEVLKNEIEGMRNSFDKIKDMKKTIISIKNIKVKMDKKYKETEFKLNTSQRKLNEKNNSLDDFKHQIKKLRKENLELAKFSHKNSINGMNNSEINSRLKKTNDDILELKSEQKNILNSFNLKITPLKNELNHIKSNFNNEISILLNEKKRILKEKEVIRLKNQKLNEAFEEFKKEMKKDNNNLKPNQQYSQNNSFNIMNEIVLEDEIKDSQIYKQIEKKNEILEIDLKVHKIKNEELLNEIFEIKQEFNKLNQILMSENFVEKLNKYENENQMLNDKNQELLKSIYEEKQVIKKMKNLELVNDQLIKENKQLKQKVVNSFRNLNNIETFRTENDISSVENPKMQMNNKNIQQINEMKKSQIKSNFINFQDAEEFQFMVEEDDSFIEHLKENYQDNKSKKINSLGSSSHKKLYGTSFLKRFDVLMNINEESKNINNISLKNLLNYNYLYKNIFQNNVINSKNYFKGKIEESCLLFDKKDVKIICKSFYKKYLSEFKIFYEIEILNSKLEKIYFMVPKIFTEEGMDVQDKNQFDDNIEISSQGQISIQVSVSISQMNLPFSHPPLFLFFLFSKTEFDQLIFSSSTENIRFSKNLIPLPYNICKFLNYPKCSDFSIIETMGLTQEMMISNKNISLETLKKLLPNLGDLDNSISVDKLIQKNINILEVKFICFGSKIQTYLGSFFVVIEYVGMTNSLLTKMYSLNDSDLSTSIMYYFRSILQNV